MKPIEYALDKMLETLEHNWNQPKDRLFLNGEGFLKQMEYPIRLEYFREIIDILRTDGYADLAHPQTEYGDNKNKWYENSTIITARGLLFLKQGGYQQKTIDDTAQRRKMERNEERLVLWTRNLFWGTVAVAVGAVGLVIWEIWHYFHSCE